MDDLKNYIITYYAHLMTDKESKARRTLIAQEKINGMNGTLLAEKMRHWWVSNDPEVLLLIANGEEQFYDSVYKRIMQDHRQEVFINCCPKCDSLARTPKAKQCPKCFHSWHDN